MLIPQKPNERANHKGMEEFLQVDSFTLSTPTLPFSISTFLFLVLVHFSLSDEVV